jgi:peptide deformylase
MSEREDKITKSHIERLFGIIDGQDTIDDVVYVDDLVAAHRREIVLAPNEKLHRRSDKVSAIDQEIKQLVLDMYLTMRRGDGIGIAAPQVGVLKRVIVIHLVDPIVMINPVIIHKSEETMSISEGCLSSPGLFKTMKRSAEITVSFHDLDGLVQVVRADGLQAAVIQHEVDHLDGKTIFKKPASPTRRMMDRMFNSRKR